MSPSMLQLRMNRQNLINEMRLHNGKISSQFMLAKPRPTQSPKTKLPPMGNGSVPRRPLRRKTCSSKASYQEDGVLLPRRGSLIERKAPAESADDCAKAGHEEPAEDKTSELGTWMDEAKVTRVLDSRLLSSIFRSMQEKDGSGLPRDRVVRCLEILGYKCLDSSLVEECLQDIPGCGPLSLGEFAKLAAAFSSHQRARFQERFREIDYRNTGYVSVREFRSVLRELGFAMSPAAMAELLEEVGVGKQMQMDWSQFEAALLSVHERFGFSASEVAEMEAVFDKYDQTGSGVLSAEELAGVMGWLGHPQSIEQAQATLARFDVSGDNLLDKLEFLLAVRQWQNEEVELASKLFAEHDGDGDGLMTIHELVTLFEKLGYTVLPHVVEEGIRTVKAHTAGLMFEEVLHLLKRLRSQECFSDQERSELTESFRRFDRRGQGCLRQFELARLLDWLGYQHTSHRCAELWVRVDVDKSGLLEQGEFLKLLRYLREEEASAARQMLTEMGDWPLGQEDIRELLESLGYAPSEEILHDAMTLMLDPGREGPTSLREVLAFLHTVRDMQAAKLRENEGLLDHVVEKINSRFQRHFSRCRPVEAGELERLLHHLFPAARHSKEDREHVRQFIAGGSAKLRALPDLYALVRRFGEERDERAWQREANVIAATGFGPAQVAQFREVFVQADVNCNGYLDEDETRRALEDIVARRMVKDESVLELWDKPESRARCTDFSSLLQVVHAVTARSC